MHLDFDNLRLETRSTFFNPEWEIPKLCDFDDKQVALKFDERFTLEWEKIWSPKGGLDFELEYDENDLDARILQGVFRLPNKNMIEIRNCGANLGAYFLGKELKIFEKIAHFTPDLYGADDNYYGNIPHRFVDKHFRRIGIASYGFERLEKFLKSNGINEAVIGTDRRARFEKFLEKRGYELSGYNNLAADDKFAKDLEKISADATDNFLKVIKFPVIAARRQVELIIPKSK